MILSLILKNLSFEIVITNNLRESITKNEGCKEKISYEEK